MPTEFINSVKATGGDYSTRTLWEAATDIDLTASSTKVFAHGGITGTVGDGASITGDASSATGTVVNATATQILVLVLTGTFTSGEKMEVDASNHVTISDAGDSAIAVCELVAETYTDNLTVGGATTSATNYRKMTAAIGSRHAGIAGVGPLINPSSAGHAHVIDDENFHVEWVSVTGWTGSSAEGFRVNGTGFDISYSLIHDGAGNNSDGILFKVALTASIYMCAIYSMNRMGVMIQNIDNVNLSLSHSVGWDCNIKNLSNYCCFGYDSDSQYNCDGGSITAKNCYADDNGSNGDAYGYTGGTSDWAGSSNNGSSDISAPGTSSVESVAASGIFVSIVSGSEDFHLKTGTNDLVEAGVTVTGITLDVDGDTIAATPDIGIDQRDVVSGGLDISIAAYHYNHNIGSYL